MKYIVTKQTVLNSKGSITNIQILAETKSEEKAERLRAKYDEILNKNYGKNEYPVYGIRYYIGVDEVMEEEDIDKELLKEYKPL